MTRHWVPLDGPQRVLMRLRERRDGVPRSTVDIELPLMALLAVLVGIGVVVWLNGQSSPESGEIRRVTERPILANPREALAAGAAQRAAAAREQARLRKMRATRRAARARAASAAAAARRSYYTNGDPRYQNGYQNGYQGYPGNSGVPGYTTSGQTYTQQQVQRAPAPKPAPKPQPKRSGGGGGGAFDDSG